MKGVHKDLPRILETGDKALDPDNITSSHIVKAAMQDKDELCLKVVHKFSEILAREVGNMALKTLPFGGIYLIGGVTMGISDYLNHESFLNEVYKKGRLEPAVRRVPIFVVKPDVELGMLGATECAFRLLGCYACHH